MKYAEKCRAIYSRSRNFCASRWDRFVGYITSELDERKARKQQESSVDRAARRTATATVWMAIFTCVLAGTSYLQWREIHSGSTDTHDLAVHAKEQADKMKDMSDAADKISQAAENMVAEDSRIADNAEKAMKASNEQSKSALDASIANSRLDERAWVGLLYPIKTADGEKLKVGRVVFKFRFKNSGKTPAINVAYDILLRGTAPGDPIPDYGPATPEETYAKFTGIHESTVIAPGEEQFISFPQTVFYGPKQIEMTEKRQTILYFVGKVSYNDVFPNTPRHTTKLCVVYEPDTGEVGTCPINNTMD